MTSPGVVLPGARRSRAAWSASRAASTTSCPPSNSRPPMVPPTAPAPMMMYRIPSILTARPIWIVGL